MTSGRARGFPTMSAYIAWARAAGCIVDIADAGRDAHHLIVTIGSEAGRRAVEIVLDLDEPLASTSIARLDRRLGLKSYMFT